MSFGTQEQEEPLYEGAGLMEENSGIDCSSEQRLLYVAQMQLVYERKKNTALQERGNPGASELSEKDNREIEDALEQLRQGKASPEETELLTARIEALLGEDMRELFENGNPFEERIRFIKELRKKAEELEKKRVQWSALPMDEKQILQLEKSYEEVILLCGGFLKDQKKEDVITVWRSGKPEVRRTLKRLCLEAEEITKDRELFLSERIHCEPQGKARETSQRENRYDLYEKELAGYRGKQLSENGMRILAMLKSGFLQPSVLVGKNKEYHQLGREEQRFLTDVRELRQALDLFLPNTLTVKYLLLEEELFRLIQSKDNCLRVEVNGESIEAGATGDVCRALNQDIFEHTKIYDNKRDIAVAMEAFSKASEDSGSQEGKENRKILIRYLHGVMGAGRTELEHLSNDRLLALCLAYLYGREEKASILKKIRERNGEPQDQSD